MLLVFYVIHSMLYRLLTTGRSNYNDVNSFFVMIIVLSSDFFKVLTLRGPELHFCTTIDMARWDLLWLIPCHDLLGCFSCFKMKTKWLSVVLGHEENLVLGNEPAFS